MVTGENASEDSGEEGRRLPRLRANAFARLVRWSMLHPIIVMAVWSVILGAGSASTHLIELDWRSEKPAVTDPNWQRLRAAFAATADPVVIEVEHADPKQARASADRLADTLAQRTDLFREVFVPGGSRFLEENGLLYLDRAEIERIVARLENSAPLFRGLAAAPDLGGLAVLAEQAARAVAQGGAPGGLSALFREAARTVAAQKGTAPHDFDWMLLAGDRVDLDSTQWYVFAYPANADDRSALAAAVAEAEAQARTLPAPPGQAIATVVTGRPVLTQPQPAPPARAFLMQGLIALILSSVLLIFALSGPSQLLAILITLAAAAAATAGIIAWVSPMLDRAGLAAPVVFLGLGAPALIALALRAEQAQRHGVGMTAAWMLSAQRLGASLTAWLLLTAIAGIAIHANDWAGIGSAGLATAASATAILCAGLTLLPAFIRLSGGPWADEEPHWLDDLLQRPEPPFLYGMQQGLAVILLVVAAAGAFLFPDLRFSFVAPVQQIIDGPAADVFARAAQREPSLRASVHVMASEEEARDLARQLADLPEIGSVRTIESFLPPEQEEKRAILARLHNLLPQTPDRSNIAPDATLRGSVMRLEEGLRAIAAASSDADLKSAAEEFRTSLAALDAAVPAGDAELRRLDTALFANLSQLLARVEALSQTPPLTVATIDPVVRRQFVSAEGQWRIEIIPREAGNTPAFLAAVQRVAPQAAGPRLCRTAPVHAGGGWTAQRRARVASGRGCRGGAGIAPRDACLECRHRLARSRFDSGDAPRLQPHRPAAGSDRRGVRPPCRGPRPLHPA